MIFQKPFYYLFSGKTTLNEQQYVDVVDRGIYYGIASFQAIVVALKFWYNAETPFFDPMFLQPFIIGYMLKFCKQAYCKQRKCSMLVKKAEFKKSKTWLETISSTAFITAAGTLVILVLLEKSVHEGRRSFYELLSAKLQKK